MQRRKPEQGSSLAWTAVFLITVLMPLMLLVIDGSRLLYVRGRLQTATDAACEDAAWAAGDRPNYIDTGQTRLSNDWYVIEVAQNTFVSTLNERTRMAFSPMLAVTLDYTNNQILCSATAQVPVLFNAVGVAPQVNLSSNTIAAIRFR
jgi:Flp pilus assembly protein TadG